MGYAGKTINGWCFEGAVNEEGVVMADECCWELDGSTYRGGGIHTK